MREILKILSMYSLVNPWWGSTWIQRRTVFEMKKPLMSWNILHEALSPTKASYHHLPSEATEQVLPQWAEEPAFPGKPCSGCAWRWRSSVSRETEDPGSAVLRGHWATRPCLVPECLYLGGKLKLPVLWLAYCTFWPLSRLWWGPRTFRFHSFPTCWPQPLSGSFPSAPCLGALDHLFFSVIIKDLYSLLRNKTKYS